MIYSLYIRVIITIYGAFAVMIRILQKLLSSSSSVPLHIISIIEKEKKNV